MAEASKIRLGELLISEGLIDDMQLSSALGEQARWGNRLGETLVRMGFLTEPDLVRGLSRCFGVPGIDLLGKNIEPEVLEMVPTEVAEKYLCLPLFTKCQGGVETLFLGMDDPSNLAAIDDVSFRTGLNVRPVLVGPIQIREAVGCYYRGEGGRGSQGLVIAEAPLLQGETAPMLAPPLIEENEFLLEDLAPQNDGSTAVGESSGGDSQSAATREILQAVTRLLLQRGVFSRTDLLAAVEQVRSARNNGDESDD